jgi:two-component system CheB/CheR fusion protein
MTEINNDINNLFTSTEVGIIFLDTQLGIRRFTPNMTQFFNLIPTDAGRSLRDITSKTGDDRICQDAEEVLATLQTKEMEIKAGGDGKWYNLRFLPYRTSENMIDGVVLTFVDITERKSLESLIQAARIYAESIVDTVREPLLVLRWRLDGGLCQPVFLPDVQDVDGRDRESAHLRPGRGPMEYSQPAGTA